ncbi:unnamed protein product [Effrenium voratum]|uniref:Uncharacterized protein n=1 Tax=Effrenium voratum TaxID=2562239 RepID=A0AA36HJN6_9DINO|nr:unnamed protein product [Effrenium voratum]CAJ1443403.1 unnamed protein product [Effrenium voratum]
MTRLAWAILLPLAAAQQPTKDWCATGTKLPDFTEDEGQASVELVYAQSPLFSTNPKIGTKLRWLNLYHTALVVVQKLPGVEPKNWTIEFDSVTNVAGAVLPNISGMNLTWNNDARYCVTEGILWGEAHWSKMFEVAVRLSAAQARQIFTEFIPSVNNTAHHTKPLYQLWRAQSRTDETLVKDITCGDGVNWILHYAATVLQVKPVAGFELKFTSIVFRADRLDPVDSSEWTEVVKYFQSLVQFMGPHQSELQRFLEFLHLMPIHYVYDSNAKAYFRVEGNHFPWLEIQYQPIDLEGPPWNHTELTRLPETVIV